MKLLQMKDYQSDSVLIEPTLQLFPELYPDNTQVQPLTPLMEEIIEFQLKERALFASVDISRSFLN
jgi:hypothetical protein